MTKICTKQPSTYNHWRTQEKIRGFSRLWPALQGVGGAEPAGSKRISENLQKYCLTKLQKCILFAYFSKRNSKPCIISSGVWTKIPISWENYEKIQKNFDENSKEKLNFYLFLKNLLLQIEPLEIPSLIYNIFQVRGGDLNPHHPLRTPLPTTICGTTSIPYYNSNQ